jgi:hypothetical protein
MGVLVEPFDVAADGVGQFDGGFLVGEQSLECVAQFVRGFFAGMTGAVVQAADVAKFALGVEDVEMGGAQGAVGFGDGFRRGGRGRDIFCFGRE